MPDDDAKQGRTQPPQPAGIGLSPDAPAAPPVVDVARLMSPRGEAVLVHAGQAYRLRITARGKLILTK